MKFCTVVQKKKDAENQSNSLSIYPSCSTPTIACSSLSPPTGKSYRELVEISAPALKLRKPALLQMFLRDDGFSRGFKGAEPEWSDMERVIASRTNSRTGFMEILVKWKGQDYSDVTWYQLTPNMSHADQVSCRLASEPISNCFLKGAWGSWHFEFCSPLIM